MSEPRYALDARTELDVRRHVRAAAARSSLPAGEESAPTWAELLFDGDELAAPSEPSHALIAGLVELHVGLAAHVNTLPARILGDWLRHRLGIEPLAAVPDRVVVTATADPARTPVVVPAASVVRAKDSAGADRRYATTETLTVHGTELLDVRAYAARTGTAGVVDTAVSWIDRDAPFVPFPDTPAAVHTFAVVSDLLAFDRGELTVRLTFEGGDARLLDGATWFYPSTAGPRIAERLRSSATEIDLNLVGACIPDGALGEPSRYVRASFPAGGVDAGALSFAFTSMGIEVLKRPGLAPDAGFYNDGRLDVTKEFQPFGPTARRGDAFYVRSDEALAKPLDRLVVRLQLIGPGGSVREVRWGGIPEWKYQAAQTYGVELHTGAGTQFGGIIDNILGLFEEESRPRVEWQRYDGTAWTLIGSTEGALATFTWEDGAVEDAPTSRPFELAGEPGYLVRAFLAEGDFGWSDYLKRVASFAAAAAGSGTPNASLLIPPDPPVVSSITLDYSTRKVEAGAISVDGWATRRREGTGPYYPFAVPLDTSAGEMGMVAIGLELGAGALGTTVSFYVDVESAAACGSEASPSLEWQYCTSSGGWDRLDVADGTAGLRQPGLVRFVAPLDWREGSDDTSASVGRWLRAVTEAPGRVGALRSIVPDAVEAAHVATDAAAYAVPLEATQVKGLLAPVPGVKKLTNLLPGFAGRSGEDAESRAYLERASGAVRHRQRSIQGWDYEELVRVDFPEVAVVQCLPHTDAAGDSSPGSVGLVVIPRSAEPMPLPSVSLAERIRARLAPALPVHARPTVLCPLYVPVTVCAELVLARGAPAVDARRRITGSLERFLHPTTHDPVRFGRELFASSVAAFLESLPDVDHLDSFILAGPGGPAERVTVDACRGLVASSGLHSLVLEEQL